MGGSDSSGDYGVKRCFWSTGVDFSSVPTAGEGAEWAGARRRGVTGGLGGRKGRRAAGRNEAHRFHCEGKRLHREGAGGKTYHRKGAKDAKVRKEVWARGGAETRRTKARRKTGGVEGWWRGEGCGARRTLADALGCHAGRGRGKQGGAGCWSERQRHGPRCSVAARHNMVGRAAHWLPGGIGPQKAAVVPACLYDAGWPNFNGGWWAKLGGGVFSFQG